MYLYTNSLPGLGKAQQCYAPHKLITIAATLLMVCSFHSFTQAQSLIKQWDKSYGNDFLISAFRTSERGYLLAGTSGIVNIDSNGTKLWDKALGVSVSSRDVISSIIKTEDGGYLLAGSTEVEVEVYYGTTWYFDYLIIKIDKEGNKQWSQTFNGHGQDELYSVIQTDDKGYLLAGISGIYDNYAAWVIKTDSIGNFQWDKMFDFGSGFQSVFQTSDGNYLLAGNNYSGHWILKIDEAGTQLWSKNFLSNAHGHLTSAILTKDNGFLLAGGYVDYWVVKVDSVGNKQWDKTFGGDNFDALTNVIQTSDKNYLLAGYSLSNISRDKTEFSRGEEDYWVVKIDSIGNKLWDKRFGGTSTDKLNSVFETSPGSYLLTGSSKSSVGKDKSQAIQGEGTYDYWIVKTYEKELTPAEPFVVMSDTAITICRGTFYDPGYLDNYSNTSESTQTFSPATSGESLRIVFTSFHLSPNDYLYIYDGTSDRAPLQGIYSGELNYPPDTIIANNPTGGLTFRFVSDTSQTAIGWVIDMACVSKPTTPTPITAIWNKRFGGNHYDVLSSMIQTGDGSYLLAGSSASDKGGDKSEDSRSGDEFWLNKFDYWVVKMGKNGNKLWDKLYGGTNEDGLSKAIHTSDGGYLLAGDSKSESGADKSEDSRGEEDYWVVKIDSTGNKLWDKRFGGTDIDLLGTVIQTSDQGYLLAGWSDSPVSGDKTQANKGSSDYWIIKIDKDGSKLWDKTYGGNSGEVFSSMIQTSDGGFLLGGTSISDIGGDKTENSKGTNDYWIIKISANGTKEWDKTFGGSHDEGLSTVMETKDQKYILTGYSFSGISGDKSEENSGSWVIKIDKNGNKLWDKTFAMYDFEYIRLVVETSDGNYLLGGSGIIGNYSEESRGSLDYNVAKIDQDGKTLWNKRFGGDNAEHLSSVIQDSDGSYLLAGYSFSGIGGDKTVDSRGLYDYWIVKTTPDIVLPAALQINFQDRYSKPPTGWLKDYGLPFAEKLLSDTTYTFGWKQSSDGQPVDLSVGGTFSGNGRWRPAPTDVLLATLMHMQGNHVQNFRGNPTEAYWELAVENGDYQVTVSVGDGAKYTGTDLESHSIHVEGVAAITHFIPQGGNGATTRFKQAMVKVEVTDGLLTIDADGGTNTKINYAIIQPLNAASLVAVARAGVPERKPVLKQFRVYPNPFFNKLTVESKLRGEVNISLYDSMGNIYYQATQELESREVLLDLSAVGMKAGIYLLKLQHEDGSSQISKVLRK